MSSAAKDTSITHAAAARSNLDAVITKRAATRDSRNAKNYTHTGTTTCCKTQRKNQNDRSRTCRTQEVPFIVACSHFTQKKQGFVLRLPPHSIAHATVTRPFHCDLQPEIQETQRTTHTGTTTCCKTQRRNQNDRSRTRRTQEVPVIVACSHFAQKKQGFVLRLPPHNIAHATVMQPFHCDLQPEIQETQRTTHTGTTTCCKTQRRNQNDRSRTRRTQEVPVILACSHFTRKTHKVSCSGFLLQHSCHPSSRSIPYILILLLCIVLLCIVLWSTTFYHPSSRSIPLLLSLLLCIVLLCIVMWSTTLHQGQFHRFLFFCYVLLCYVLLCDLPPFIKVNSIAS